MTARTYALQLLDLILSEGATFDEALARLPFQGSDADQKFAHLLTLTVLRHVGQLDQVVAAYLERPIPAKRRTTVNALRLGAAQLLLLDTPAHAAVNETVELVKETREKGFAGLINAVLQKIAREKPALPPAQVNLPKWLSKRWEKWYGADAVTAIAAIAATRPPLDVNTHTEMEGTRLDHQIVRLPAEHPPVETLPGYDSGAFFIQDLAASYPARLLGNVNGFRVLDLCAAPGGKTAQLARDGAVVTALDRSIARLRTLNENMRRLKHDVYAVPADALEWEPEMPFDFILLDAPCSATGTWRRHPEVVHHASREEIAELAELQRELLFRAWTWLKPGGKLVYCVCSLEREEGEDQAYWFLRQQLDSALAPIPAEAEIPANCITPEGYIRTRPDLQESGMDGFFIACFAKA